MHHYALRQSLVLKAHSCFEKRRPKPMQLVCYKPQKEPMERSKQLSQMENALQKLSGNNTPL